MAFFSSGKNKKENKTATPASSPARTVGTTSVGFAHILKAPRITEKGSGAQAEGVYVFNVAQDATKRDVVAAVKNLYGVSALKVRILAIPQKKVRHMRTGRYGMTRGGKKAYVYLKSGDRITIT